MTPPQDHKKHTHLTAKESAEIHGPSEPSAQPSSSSPSDIQYQMLNYFNFFICLASFFFIVEFPSPTPASESVHVVSLALVPLPMTMPEVSPSGVAPFST